MFSNSKLLVHQILRRQLGWLSFVAFVAVGLAHPAAAAAPGAGEPIYAAGNTESVWLPFFEGPGDREVAVLRDRARAILRLWSASGLSTLNRWRSVERGARVARRDTGAHWSFVTQLDRYPALPAAGRPTRGTVQRGQTTGSAERQAQVTSAAPSASPISGYMDFHFNAVEGQDAVLDFHRFVLIFAHSFSDRIRFVAELELEHAVVSDETTGELELEQAYVDFLVSRPFNVRVGMVLAPVGIINERHEPPVFHGVERPLVDTVIVPTTWFDAGVGFHGEVGRGFRYRVYAMGTLDSSGFSAETGIRDGRQKGARSNARNVAGAGRLEYVGTPGLVVGTSFWSGDTGFAFPRLDNSVTMIEFDGRYRVGELETKGQYAHGFLDGMGELNDTIQRAVGVNPNIAEQIRGFYLEGSYFVLARPAPRELAAFVRYENFDTQYRMPSGFEPLKEFDRDAWIFGVTYFPDPDVAVKVDYTVLRNQSAVIDAPSSFNFGLGWWF